MLYVILTTPIVRPKVQTFQTVNFDEHSIAQHSYCNYLQKYMCNNLGEKRQKQEHDDWDLGSYHLGLFENTESFLAPYQRVPITTGRVGRGGDPFQRSIQAPGRA